jgi:hypothetical protein
MQASTKELMFQLRYSKRYREEPVVSFEALYIAEGIEEAVIREWLDQFNVNHYPNPAAAAVIRPKRSDRSVLYDPRVGVFREGESVLVAKVRTYPKFNRETTASMSVLTLAEFQEKFDPE